MSEKIRVLMVDDEEQFRLTSRKILDRKGFETLLAASGPEAITRMDEDPEVVVLDIKMPGLGGLEVLKKIKTISPQTPVIMLTGHGSEESARQALTEGAFDYLAKPCDIDILAAKIIEARRSVHSREGEDERMVREVMVPLAEYTVLGSEVTISEAMTALRESFSIKMATERIMETGHRSILVMDPDGQCRGILAITDLLKAIMPAYLSAPRPSTADAVQFSPMFWQGMFTREVKILAGQGINRLMSPVPPTIPDSANLAEACFLLVSQQARRLIVVREGQPVGVIREQDLFFEMVRLLT